MANINLFIKASNTKIMKTINQLTSAYVRETINLLNLTLDNKTHKKKEFY